ncbi:hypothetical protein H072_1463 [Dactylellina haptotyla CBS 200.50]|uniref:Uncharacterized protein n=1 Tax=Dactylellina haptotyla (strain CBS 200.50) TaxID=1284197 RepID=S8CA31_DACHA|nr:hypothetical protein H072_1463 [Dactylellina haptotyla CBS 200.50]
MTRNKAPELTPRQQIHRIPNHEVLNSDQDFTRYNHMSRKTRKMISHPDDSDDGLLGESTYEILSDLSIPSHSDDDDDLSSLASLAEDTADEDEDEEGEEFTFPNPNSEPPKDTVQNLERSAYAESVPDVPDTFESAGIPSYNGLDQHEHLDTPSSISEVSISDVTIQFNDENVPLGEDTSLSYDLEEFTGAEFDTLCAAIGTPEDLTNLHSVLRCSLEVEPLSVKDTFRVIYIGDESAKDEIFRKLGAALVVHSTSCESLEDSKSSARFNVVPVTSFGSSSATPDVELVESFGLEMAVDTCAFAYPSNEAADEISLVIKPRTLVRSLKTSNGYKLDKMLAPGWRLPNLAIFYCEEDDDARKRSTRSWTRSFLTRHGVPFLAISDKKLYKSSEDFQIDHRALHMAVETRKIEENNLRIREVFKELPVDIHNFINLDVQQLSRNLAIIVKQQDEDESRTVENIDTPWNKLVRVFNDMLDGGSDQTFNVFMVIISGILLSFLCLGISIFLTSFVKPPAIIANPTTSVSMIQTSITTKTQTQTALGIATSKSSVKLSSTKQTPLASSSSVSVVTKAKPTSSPQSKAASSSVMTTGVTSLSVTDIPSLPANESGEFTMYTISEGHIVLRSPAKFAALRKPPTLIVHVKRRNYTVPVEVNKLFRGVYAIKMDSNEAWGVLNITVRTENKPIIKQAFVLDLGNPWLSTSAWKRSVLATSSDLRKAVNKASSKANVYAQKIQASGKMTVKNAKRDVKQLQKEAVKLQKELTKQSKVAKKTVESQLKLLRNGFDELKIEQYLSGKSLKEYSEKFDKQIQKARLNANRLWNKGSDAAKKSNKKRRMSFCKKAKSCGVKCKNGKKGKNGKCKMSR